MESMDEVNTREHKRQLRAAIRGHYWSREIYRTRALEECGECVSSAVPICLSVCLSACAREEMWVGDCTWVSRLVRLVVAVDIDKAQVKKIFGPSLAGLSFVVSHPQYSSQSGQSWRAKLLKRARSRAVALIPRASYESPVAVCANLLLA